MLKFKSFAITDAEGVNMLLENNRLAAGSNVLVSNSGIMVPYEDGEEPTIEQKIVKFKELRLDYLGRRDIMIHSQMVLEKERNGAVLQRDQVQATVVDIKGKYDENKKKQDKVKVLDNVIAQKENQMLMNEAEMTNIMANIEVLTELITMPK